MRCMKLDLSKQEITMLIAILSQVRVQLDNASQLLELRRKLQDAVKQP